METTRMNAFLRFVGHCLLLSVIVLPCAVKAQFPRACTSLEIVLSKECCPPINGTGSQCGVTEGRGQCDDITIDDAPYGDQYVLLGIDDRERWPERFFNRSCVCNGNFAGFDCSRCRPGWQGDDCQERRAANVRQNIMEMTEEQRTNFLDVLDRSKTTPHPDYVVASEHYRNLLGANGTDPQFVNITIYDLFTWNHYYSVRDTLLGPGQTYTAIDFSHEGPAFLTWHRMHLLALEDDLQRLSGDPTFALPYWNFAIGGSECDICTDELLGSQDPADPTLLGNNSRFADWEVVCLSMDWYNDNVKLCNGTFEGPVRRNPGGNVERPEVQVLPQPDDVESCVRVETYDNFPFYSDSNSSFRNALEGYSKVDGEFEVGVRTLHNLAHLFLNGTGGITHASANDPIFVLLHSFTDAIFEEWLIRNNATEGDYPVEDAPIGHNLNFNMVPFFPPVKNRGMFVSSEQLGYSYSVQFAAAEPSETLATTESFIWASVGVLAFIVLNVLVALSVAAARRYKRRQKEEDLYQSLISDDNNPGIMYTS